ncbi:hypothetical protein EON62_02225 [archaeon]|nr:MAG: hypothetical protein EON62_02225 [archaeon]
MHALIGKASAPQSAGSLHQKGAAKKLMNFSIPVNNWLRSTQTFSVAWTTSGMPASAQLRGAKSMDVPGLGRREYKMTYYTPLEGKATSVVTFTNEATGEYLSFDVVMECAAPGVMDVIDLETIVRSTASHTLVIENPLAAARTPITWAAPVCDHPAVRVVKLGDMTGMPEGRWQVEYRPLVPTLSPAARAALALQPPSSAGGSRAASRAGTKEDKAAAAPAAHLNPAANTSARVVLHSDQLGDYIYDLNLKAAAAGLEPALRFTCALGMRQTQVFRFKHFDKAAATFKASVTRPDVFTMPPVVTVAPAAPPADAWDGVDAVIEVAFEGTAIGNVNAELTLASDTSGVYVVPLIADCQPPRPAGPFTLAPGGSTSVEFRNVFNEEREFIVSTDNPSVFAVTPAGTVKLARKAATNLVVRYMPPATAAASDVAGKVVVACPANPDLPPWVFYLRGASDASAPPANAKGATGAAAGARAPSASRTAAAAGAGTPAVKKK